MLEEHRWYLSDAPRLRAFRRAIVRLVRPGDVVLDLGAGTGVLGLMALRAGAARVIAVESGPVLEVAREMVAAAGFADRWTGIRGLSTEVDLPERADLLVSDNVGGFGLDYGITGPYADARRRHLRRGARILPEVVEVRAALLSSPRIHERVAAWNDAPPAVRRLAANTVTFAHPRRREILSAPARVLAVDLRTAGDGAFRGRAVLRASRAAVVHGLCGFFRARLAPGVTLTNQPFATGELARSPVFLPLETPVRVARGERVPVGFLLRPTEGQFTWTVAGATHSTFHGRPLAAGDLLRLRPEHRPRLSPRGEATALVLDLCRRGKSVKEIRAALRRRFHRDDAFVAEVLESAAW